MSIFDREELEVCVDILIRHLIKACFSAFVFKGRKIILSISLIVFRDLSAYDVRVTISLALADPVVAVPSPVPAF